MKNGISKILDKVEENIHPLILRNLTRITRECFFCKRKFKTTVGGPHICCSRQECQRKYQRLSGEVKYIHFNKVGLSDLQEVCFQGKDQ